MNEEEYVKVPKAKLLEILEGMKKVEARLEALSK